MRICTVICMLFSFYVSAQQENNVWVFGSNAGLDFNSGQPVPIRSATGHYGNVPSVFSTLKGFASVSDRHTGALLFYSDGRTVYDRNHDPMPDGTFLSGNAGDGGTLVTALTEQGCLIVPFPGDSNRYYLFSLGTYLTPKLYYSVVDITLNSGLGNVVAVERNVLLDGGSTADPDGRFRLSSSMIAVGGNNCDVWLIVHDYINPVFKAYHITNSGIDPNPVLSTAGTQIQGQAPGMMPTGSTYNFFAYEYSTMDVSPNRQYIAITSSVRFLSQQAPGSNTVRGAVLCRFDPNTGIVSGGVLLEKDIACNAVVFSPGNTKLYIKGTAAGVGFLSQYDITAYDLDTILTSRLYAVNQSLDGSKQFRRWKDKIYCTGDSIAPTPPGYPGFSSVSGGVVYTLSVINTPDLPGVLCDYQSDILTFLPGTHTFYALSSEVVYPVPQHALVLDTLVCTSGGWSDYPLVAREGYAAYEWDDHSSERQRVINGPGIYWVRYRTRCNNWNVDTFTVQHTDIPVNLGADTVICKNQWRMETDSISDAVYLWQDGSRENFFETEQRMGTYWVRVEKGGCTFSDTIMLELVELPQYLGVDTTYCRSAGIELLLAAVVTDGAAVLWSTGGTAASITVREEGHYWVTVGYDVCTGTDTLVVTEELCDDCRIMIPDAFTPNGDGRNDLFRAMTEKACPVTGYDLQIFNRWGQLVFSGTAGMPGWDGRYNGMPAEAGVYYYRIRMETGTRRAVFEQKGNLTLIR